MKRSKSKKIKSRLGLEVVYCRYCGCGYSSVHSYYHEGDRYICCDMCDYVYDTQKDKEIWDKTQIEQIKSKANRIEEEHFAKIRKRQAQTGPSPLPDWMEEGLPFN